MLAGSVFFFFQAEDGIRDIGVTGVQTCALPISRVVFSASHASEIARSSGRIALTPSTGTSSNEQPSSSTRRSILRIHLREPPSRRSEERRVGKECRSRWAARHEKKERRTDNPRK